MAFATLAAIPHHPARRLILTITAFTAAHSVTLGLAVFGWLKLPAGPIEAIIAMSIVLLAVENVHQHQGRPGITSRRPWLVSFAFGLIHGLGFSGALGDLGLPQAEIPTALLFFNLGVEGGQLLFVAAWLLLAWPLKHLTIQLPAPLKLVPHYLLGICGSYWMFERTLAILTA